MSQDDKARAFTVKVNSDIQDPNVLYGETLEVKKGPQAWKAAKIRAYGNRATGEERKLEFSVVQYGARAHGPGYQFDERPEKRWYCEGDEVDALRAFLNGELREAGRYIRVDSESVPESILNTLREGTLSGESFAVILKKIAETPDLVEQLLDSDGASLLAELLEARRQRIVLDRLRRVVLHPKSTEHDIQKVLEQDWWIFGGRFIGKEERRNLTVLDSLDIPLIRSDGSLYIVELKKANIPRLTEKPRNHVIAGREVHEAAMQAVNYLRSLDHKRDSVWTDFKVDCSRASAVVVIGHPQFDREHSERDIAEALRTYNAALNRVEVITYKDLIDGAARALQLSDVSHSENRKFGHGVADDCGGVSEAAWDPFSDDTPF